MKTRHELEQEQLYWWLTAKGLKITKTRKSKHGGVFVYYPAKGGQQSSVYVEPEDIINRELHGYIELIKGEQK